MSKISQKLDKKIRIKAKNRCGYCLAPQELVPQKLEIEHIQPKSKGGTDEEENLCLACSECNSHKSTKILGLDPLSLKKVRLFNPNKQIWSEHFEWNSDKTKILGLTDCGRATIIALQMNNNYLVTARIFWKLTGIFPPTD
ncbi:MAG: HNH endonuclease [Pyrinomonadaceae bacterium]|nr:HNH endonuclease [Pyrinomonadaceae bacterium]